MKYLIAVLALFCVSLGVDYGANQPHFFRDASATFVLILWAAVLSINYSGYKPAGTQVKRTDINKNTKAAFGPLLAVALGFVPIIYYSSWAWNVTYIALMMALMPSLWGVKKLVSFKFSISSTPEDTMNKHVRRNIGAGVGSAALVMFLSYYFDVHSLLAVSAVLYVIQIAMLFAAYKAFADDGLEKLLKGVWSGSILRIFSLAVAGPVFIFFVDAWYSYVLVGAISVYLLAKPFVTISSALKDHDDYCRALMEKAEGMMSEVELDEYDQPMSFRGE